MIIYSGRDFCLTSKKTEQTEMDSLKGGDVVIYLCEKFPSFPYFPM